MIRNIIKIDEARCVGCGLCVSACHEGAIGMDNGKAKLLRYDYCDGLGNCLPVCPTNAITFEQREALEFNGVGADVNKNSADTNLPCGCPSTHSKSFSRNNPEYPTKQRTEQIVSTQLNQWPVQIKLVPVNAQYFKEANLLIAADCSAYAYGDFHNRYMRNRVTLIGCPKLDDEDYSKKLTAILKENSIKSVTVVRMSVPCCGGIENAVKTALSDCGKLIPWQVVTISTDGEILD